MPKLMTKYSYVVEDKEDGCHITVTRLLDGVVRAFRLASGRDKTVMENFMDNITDEQAEGYFPKERKKK